MTLRGKVGSPRNSLIWQIPSPLRRLRGDPDFYDKAFPWGKTFQYNVWPVDLSGYSGEGRSTLMCLGCPFPCVGWRGPSGRVKAGQAPENCQD